MSLSDDLSRPIMFHCCRDRTLTYRKKGEAVFNVVALPVFSVDTIEEAEELQVMVCQRAYGSHPLMPNEPWYKIHISLGEFIYLADLDLDDLENVTDKLREGYQMIKENKDRNEKDSDNGS